MIPALILIVDIDIPLWTEEEQDKFIKDKMLIYKEAEIAYAETNYDSSQLPKCTDDERWSSGGGHAVMKPSRKTAVKLFDSVHQGEVPFGQLLLPLEAVKYGKSLPQENGSSYIGGNFGWNVLP